MTESISSSSLFNSFAVFREILQGISAFTVLYLKNGVYPFTTNARYFEDFPNPKSGSFPGYPIIVIETEMNQERLTITDKKKISYTTTITIYTDYFIEKDGELLNSYLNAIANYFNANENVTRLTYGLVDLEFSKDRDREEIAEKQIVMGTLTCDYHVTLDVSN